LLHSSLLLPLAVNLDANPSLFLVTHLANVDVICRTCEAHVKELTAALMTRRLPGSTVYITHAQNVVTKSLLFQRIVDATMVFLAKPKAVPLPLFPTCPLSSAFAMHLVGHASMRDALSPKAHMVSVRSIAAQAATLKNPPLCLIVDIASSVAAPPAVKTPLRQI